MPANPMNPYPPDPILLVDDDRLSLESIEFLLKSNEIDNLFPCEDPRKVMKIVENRRVELILLDLVMPFVGGQVLLREISETFPEIPVIVITGVRELDTAIRCMRMGAFDYLTKPVEDNRMIYAIRRAVEFRKMREEIHCLQSHVQGVRDGRLECPEAFEDIVTSSPKMISVFQTAESVSRSNMPVLITGETGVGKSLLAESIHRCSGRRGELVSVGISGIDDAVFNDTLFGHVKGAFTGADGPRAGLIKQAEGGTLFLDEIGDLSPESQLKLLRLIQDGEYFPLGSDRPRRSDIRVVTATNQPMDTLVERGRFRKDLYYRLQTHTIFLPPLRERTEDIGPLLDHFLGKAAEMLRKLEPVVSGGVLAFLENYPFPGNVRELRSVVFDAVARGNGSILQISHFDPAMEPAEARRLRRKIHRRNGNPFEPVEILPPVSEAILLLVEESLRRTGGNKAAASRICEITRQTMTKYARQVEAYRSRSEEAT